MFAVKSILITLCKAAVVNYSVQFPIALQRNISQYLSKKLAFVIPSCMFIV
jgi:rRNA-processing protein FCF1